MSIFDANALAEMTVPDDTDLATIKKIFEHSEPGRKLKALIPNIRLEFEVDDEPAPDTMTVAEFRSHIQACRASICITNGEGGVLLEEV